LPLNLKRRDQSIAPKTAVADSALGFWKAIGEVSPNTREQRCWVHMTANVLNKLPKSQQRRGRRVPQDIWTAETRKDSRPLIAVRPRAASVCLQELLEARAPQESRE
jgi:transposase-like protein